MLQEYTTFPLSTIRGEVHTGQEKEFGVGVLKQLIKASKGKAAANAKNKLKSLGVK